MKLCSVKRKHEDDEGERTTDRAGLRPRIDREHGNEQEHRAIALPLASRPVKPVDEPSSDDPDSDSSETYWEDSSSDDSDESDGESERDEPEAREVEREIVTETEREIVIGQQPPRVVTRYRDTDGVTVLRAGSKPKIDMSFGKKSSILSRVQAFLPELEAANRDLVAESSAGRKLELDDDEALDQPHVEVVGLSAGGNPLLTGSEFIYCEGARFARTKIGIPVWWRAAITLKTNAIHFRNSRTLVDSGDIIVARRFITPRCRHVMTTLKADVYCWSTNHIQKSIH
jgi:hypothetical protein